MGKLYILFTALALSSGCIKAQWCFSNPQQFNENALLVGISSANFNTDNAPDIVCSMEYSSDLVFYFNNGSGTFNAPVYKYLSNLNSLMFTLPGDFDNDGKTDLIVAATGSLNTFEFLKGNGSGGFSEMNPVSDGAYYYAGITGYFDGDANLDWAMVDFDASKVNIFLGDGNGGYWSMVSYNCTGSNPVDIRAADLNNDQYTDLVVSEYGQISNVKGEEVYLGTGNGLFTHTFHTLNYAPQNIALPDFDHDGIKDLIVGDSYSFHAIHGNGDGTFNWPGTSYSSTAPCQMISCADMNNDGFEDLLLSGATEEIQKGTAAGTFSPVWSWNNSYCYPTTINDFDLDGRMDFADARLIDFVAVQSCTDIFLNCITGFQPIGENSPEIKCYPSPADDHITIDLSMGTIASSGSGPLRISVFDMEGKEVISYPVTSPSVITIQTADLPDGLYLLRAENSDESMETFKFNIAHQQ